MAGETNDWVPDIARLQAREDAEWLRVERSYCGRLLAYAHRRTGDHQAAEDVVQETLLGAVRGIDDFDPVFTFEQYLFGICKNRTIDYLRRRKARTLQLGPDEEGPQPIEHLARETETPSAIVRGRELGERARELFSEILREWVEETWKEREFLRLCVIEALFGAQWQNRKVWKHFDLRDETAVAGIKFRALKRLRELAAVKESGNDLLRYLAMDGDGGDEPRLPSPIRSDRPSASSAEAKYHGGPGDDDMSESELRVPASVGGSVPSTRSSASKDDADYRALGMDVTVLWREKRVSCPARHWIARLVAGTLDDEAGLFVRFHLEHMKCPWCLANKDDLSRASQGTELELLIERLRESTRRYLRSRTEQDPLG